MKILLASSNEHKKTELESLLREHQLILPEELNLSFECDETGLTYQENALQKAQALFKEAQKKNIHLPVLADDSGLDVDALPNQLGIHTARYGSKPGEPILPAEVKNALLLEAMKDVPNDKRTARFTCCLVVIMPDSRVIVAEETADGSILRKAEGSQGFGYDPVFYNNEAKGSFATLGNEEKNKHGHRGKAAEKLRLLLKNEIPNRESVEENNKWNLSALFQDNAKWEEELNAIKEQLPKAEQFKGKLGQSKEALLEFLKWTYAVSLRLETLYHYASLKYSAQSDNADNQRMLGLATQIVTGFSAALSFSDPEIIAIKEIDDWISSEEFNDYRVSINKTLRQRAHTLSAKEEEILAQQSELQETPSDTFEVLTNVDMDFGFVNEKKLSQGTFSQFLHDSNRETRKIAYTQFYRTFESHQQTLAKLYAGSVKQDIFNARVRGFDTALDQVLYADNIPKTVYTGLIDAVHKAFPSLHHYYSLRRKIMKLDELRHYDVYVPLVDSIKSEYTYNQACDIIKEALSPLGTEYTNTLYQGLTTQRWVDRYENKGKRSGAFSSGCFVGNPYILMNYKDDVLDSLFTLAHEGGHSMHTFYSRANNPYPCYDYTIFEAEVASTFNEQLIAKYLMENSKDNKTKLYLVSKQIDDIIATLFRQTMFAEFELLCHTQQENGEPLTVESIRSTYRELLKAYFGSEMIFEENSDLESLRIPHFYTHYYVYKYATGISASIALSQRVLSGGQKELNDYLSFLKSGGRRFPIEALKVAGIDMSTQEPVIAATNKFSLLLNEFENLTGLC